MRRPKLRAAVRPCGKQRSWYWAVAGSDGKLLRSGEETAPNLYYYKPWTSKQMQETAVKVRITKIK